MNSALTCYYEIFDLNQMGGDERVIASVILETAKLMGTFTESTHKRYRIIEDLRLTRGLDKYEQEMKMILSMSGDSLSRLARGGMVHLEDIMESVDIIYDNIKDAEISDRAARVQAGYAKKISAKALQIQNILLRPEEKTGSLFEEVE